MTRIIVTGETPAKKRRAHMRSCAEVLRLLAQRPYFDIEEKDMVAFLVFNLRDIYRTIDESAHAWDERNYWKKAEALREKWRWCRTTADQLSRLIATNQWDTAPSILLSIVPRFNRIRVEKITRDADWWCGAVKALRQNEGPADT